MSKAILVYFDSRGYLELLSDEERGKLMMAMLDYGERGITPDFKSLELEAKGRLDMAFSFAKAQIDRDAGAFERRAERSRENGRKGGRPRIEKNPENPLGFNKTQETHWVKKNPENPIREDKKPIREDKNPIREDKNPIREDKKPIHENRKKKNFVPPTVDDVRLYCNERGNDIDPESFVDFYTSKGWMVGKNEMKDWKAAVRNWEKNRRVQNKEVQSDEM